MAKKKTAKKKKAKSRKVICGCVDLINTELANQNTNTQLQTKLQMDLKYGRSRALPVLATERVDANKRAKPRIVVPTYCPFCGKKYPDMD